ncbi:ATP-binding protein [Crenothrix sp.]|uniref:ATP-binding protein n=1 Tax=Crenothrix sp. TaxID=3100433 RepID=UPI00374CE670
MNYSLRQRLLISLLSASMLIWGITAYISYKTTRSEVGELFDAELAQSGKVLLAFLETLPKDEPLEENWKQNQAEALNRYFPKKFPYQLDNENQDLFLDEENDPRFHLHNFNEIDTSDPLSHAFDELLQAKDFDRKYKYERKIVFQLWSEDGRLLRHSKNAPEQPFAKGTEGLSKTTIDGDLWHVFSLANTSGEYIIQVGQKQAIRTELTEEISSQLVTQFLYGMPFLGVVIWLIVGHALRPFNRLEKQLAKREASYLKPLSTQKLPSEIVPVVNEMNNLFVQLEEALEHERQFTADASHELRTPLAGLLTQAQVALRTNDETVRTQALERIKQGVNRMTYMVQQLLTFSRIESSSSAFLAKTTLCLHDEIIQVITELEPHAHKKRLQLEVVADEHKPSIIANGQLINILVKNIIDNAIKYTPNKGTVMVTLTHNNSHLTFCVEDSGPGIAPDQYELSLKRFHRCVETAGTAQGTGLGFSIVQRIASIHGATLTLGKSELGGLKVTVLFSLPKKLNELTLQSKLSFFSRKKSDTLLKPPFTQ